MSIDVRGAAAFLTTHARLLDRRRFELVFEGREPAAVLGALDAYRNSDGGYAWGLEPDLRWSGSQPIHALHAFDALLECGPAAGDRGRALCDWLATVTQPDGGLPFVLPIPDPAGCAAWFTSADSTASSLHGTAAVAGAAHRAARGDAAVAAHPWLHRATRYCVAQIERLDHPHAYELMFALRLLDAAHDTVPEAPELLAKLVATLPPSGLMHVEGGLEDEMLRPLDYAPDPGTPIRDHVPAAAVEAELDRLAALQQDDGGWPVDFTSFSPAAALEWRGSATVRALVVLRANGRLA